MHANCMIYECEYVYVYAYVYGEGEGPLLYHHLIQLDFVRDVGCPDAGYGRAGYGVCICDIYIICWDTVGEGGGRADVLGVCECK